ncbi:MAG: restriction endonuclease subunit S [Kiritimatiellae bacterium]|nr:restriction endonuclease subunit S [Kiritimatiellia bacterium]
MSPWSGIVSPAYTVIYPKARQNTTFWAFAFKHWRLVQTFQKFSQGLTSDIWNLKFPQLADIKVAMPSLEKQNAIVEFLFRLDVRTNAAERELARLMTLKSGFLQRLFV